MRYRIDCAYHGSEFHGWQKQPGLRTVQGELELWLTRILGCHVNLTGAGRTDAGVHSLGTPSHFDYEGEIDTPKTRRRLDVAVPRDMRIVAMHRVADDFHARYDALARTYTYQIRIGSWPFERDRQWQVHDVLDQNKLSECARLVLGRHDFSGFCRAESQRQNCQCTVDLSTWTFAGDCFTYTIRADRFLHEMIRLLIGTFVAAARGLWGPEHVETILSSGNVELCGDAAPPHGLTLQRVEYPQGVGLPVDFD